MNLKFGMIPLFIRRNEISSETTVERARKTWKINAALEFRPKENESLRAEKLQIHRKVVLKKIERKVIVKSDVTS